MTYLSILSFFSNDYRLSRTFLTIVLHCKDTKKKKKQFFIPLTRRHSLTIIINFKTQRKHYRNSTVFLDFYLFFSGPEQILNAVAKLARTTCAG